MSRFVQLASLLLFMLPLYVSAQTIVVSDESGNDINVEIMPADGDYLVIWLVDHAQERLLFEGMIESVNRAGFELWRVDLLADYFLPRSSENERTLSGDGVAALIEAAHQQSNKRIVLAAYDRMPLPLLRGARMWQQQHPDAESRLAGAVLYYPNLFGPPPIAGENPELDPIVNATNIPVTIYQPERGGQRLRVSELMAALWQGGAPAFVYLVPDVRDWFFMHPLEGEESDAQLATASEKRATANVPKQLLALSRMMDRLPKLDVMNSQLPMEQLTATRQVTGLVRVKEPRAMPPFNLQDISGKPFALDDYKDRVVLVNFWATWCPPCVEEVPSLNRLSEHYRDKPFSVVSIDFRESPEKIAEFTEQIAVDFPILLDQDGKASIAWKVFSFPSSFLVDRQGQLRYSVNRAIEWDTAEAKEVIDGLLAE